MSKKTNLLKVTPSKIRNKLLTEFPTIKVAFSNPILLKVPVNIWDEVVERHSMLRNILLIEGKFRIEENKNNLYLKLIHFRGPFDSQIHAYSIKEKLPKEIFKESKNAGLIFPVRFRNSFIEEENPKGLLFWYIREDVS